MLEGNLDEHFLGGPSLHVTHYRALQCNQNNYLQTEAQNDNEKIYNTNHSR